MRHFAFEDLTEMGQNTCKTYVQQNTFLVKHHEKKLDKHACKIITYTRN